MSKQNPHDTYSNYPNPRVRPQPMDTEHALGVDLGPISGPATTATDLSKQPRRVEVLQEAAELVGITRREVYGSAKANFATIAKLWEAAFGWTVYDWQVALAMDLVKTSRILASPDHQDSWVDKAGYAALGAEVTSE